MDSASSQTRRSGEETIKESLKSLAEFPHIAEQYNGGDVLVAFAKPLLEPYVVPLRGAYFAPIE
jgi:hypothetical protein